MKVPNYVSYGLLSLFHSLSGNPKTGITVISEVSYLEARLELKWTKDTPQQTRALQINRTTRVFPSSLSGSRGGIPSVLFTKECQHAARQRGI